VEFSFRLGGVPRFNLETKKTSENLNDPRWVRQSIDDAWIKSVAWALLSNFEDLAKVAALGRIHPVKEPVSSG